MEQLLVALPVLIFSVVLHEVAHGWVALKQGDPTAAMLGRLSLNPVGHLDPIGSLLVPGLLAISGAPILGWARPVPVNPRNFRDYKRGDILVSLAGVAVNFALAIVFAFVFVGIVWGQRMFPDLGTTWELLGQMAQYGIAINFVLVLFNLIPIPPLDGSHVFYHLLPPALGARYRELGKYGMIILFGILFLGGFNFIRIPLGLGQPGRPWTVADNGPVVRATIEIFGVDRCMFASNFPVDGLCARLDTILSGFKEIVRDLARADRLKLFCDNARRIYRIEA